MNSPYVTAERFSLAWFTRFFIIIQGAVIQALGYGLFLIPHKIVPGGLYGIGTVLYHLWDIPAGTSVMVMNIPLLVWGLVALGPRFGIRTVVAIVASSAATDIILYTVKLPLITRDIFVASLVGGILVGFGISLIFKSMGTTGGVEIVGQIFYRRFKWPVGKTIMVVNIAIIAMGTAVFHDLQVAIYSGITIYGISKIIDLSMEGFSYYKGVMIISDKYLEISEQLTESIKNGTLVIEVSSLATDSKRKLLMLAANRRELAFIREVINEVDPQVYIMVFNSHEVYGREHGKL